MTKKEEKVVDIADLRSDNDYNTHQDDIEIIVDVSPKVKMDDIETHSNSKTKSDKKPILEKKKVKLKQEVRRKFDPSILNSPRFAKYDGNGTEKSVVAFLTNKYSFDKKEQNPVSVFVMLFSIALYALCWYIESVTIESGAISEVITGPIFSVLNLFFIPYKKLYIFIFFILLYFFPLKRITPNMVQVFFDGLTVPNEIFPQVMGSRKRVEWKDIYTIELKKKKEIPFVQLYGQNKRLLGEMRLDSDDIKEFYAKLDIYLPENHCLRILFNNSKKS